MMTIPPQDSTEVAGIWRMRAEALWKLSKLLDDLAVLYRNAARGLPSPGANGQRAANP